MRSLPTLSLTLGTICLLIAPAAAADEDVHTLMMRATVKLVHNSSTATGFILAAPEGNKFILVTAAHVLEQTHGDETQVQFRRQQTPGVYSKELLKLTIRKEEKPLWTKHPTEDVAALAIVPPAGVDLPPVPTTLLASDQSLAERKVHPGDNLACLGFPHRNESSDAGFPLLRDGVIATFPLLPTAKTRTFWASLNIFEGDSGGPVYLVRPAGADGAEVRLILGIAVGQRFLDEEAKLVYETVKIRHRLGLALVVHASAIKETIDRLP